jgi:hypothetical protein
MSTNRQRKRSGLDWTHVVTALITAVSSILVTWLTVQGNTDNVRRELQATITVLQTQASQPTMITTSQPITITRLVEVTPTPDLNILQLDTIPSRSFVFTGGNDPLFQGSGNLSINHVDTSTKQYILNYSLPEKGFTWAGYATIYEELVNFSPYSVLEVKIQNSDNSAGIQIKLVDGTKDAVYLDVTNPPKADTRINIVAQNGLQQIRVPLRGNFDRLNLEQIRELSFIMNSYLGKGDHSLTISNVRLIK